MLNERGALTVVVDPDLLSLYPHSVGDIESRFKMVRQGLIQGDVCAPQIARTFLGREIQRALSPLGFGVAYVSHVDDILLGARSQSELDASLKALTHRLKSLPAGPLEFHETQIRHFNDRFDYLGYRVSVRKSGQAHVAPGVKRSIGFANGCGIGSVAAAPIPRKSCWPSGKPMRATGFALKGLGRRSIRVGGTSSARCVVA